MIIVADFRPSSKKKKDFTAESAEYAEADGGRHDPLGGL